MNLPISPYMGCYSIVKLDVKVKMSLFCFDSFVALDLLPSMAGYLALRFDI